MARLTAPRGTRDVLPEEWRQRYRVLDVLRSRFERAGYGCILTPTFEHTEVFAREGADSTDIVGKEMYTFEDRGGRSLSLRPEGTAPVVRAFVEHGMHRQPMPVKLWYQAQMFRYERPQEGRYREHWQIGAEAFGSSAPSADAELIALLAGAYNGLGVPNLTLRLNSLATGTASDTYREALVAYLRANADNLDEDTQRRTETNPLRAFDSKHEGTRAVMLDAPKVTDFLDDDSRAHFEGVQALLTAAGVEFSLDPTLVRGLDYHTSTVFEFSCADLGAQDAVGGGGRYDRLVEQLGGPSMPAVGFGCGMERLLLAMAAGHDSDNDSAKVDVYVGADEGGEATAFALAATLRERGIAVQLDLMERGAGRQRKQAAQIGAAIRVLAGPNDVEITPRSNEESLGGTVPKNNAAERVQSVLVQLEQESAPT
jgi:histidyl-tRNA synthetase